MQSIVIENISKSYGEVKALNNINIEVDKGEIFGLIGPDGAGKTTLFEILTTLQNSDIGNACVDGMDVQKEHREIRNIVGYMPGRFSLYQDLSVIENLEFFARIFGTTVEEGYDLIKDIWVQIEPFKKRYAGKLSGGMKQKLALCCALIHQPKVLFLDEPTTGVDPVSRKEFWDMLKNLKQRGITIFVSTPYMDEAFLCDRVALIQDGGIMKIDTPECVVSSFDRKLYDIKAGNIHNLLKVLREWENIHSCNAFGQSVHITLKDESQGNDYILDYLQKHSIEAIYIKEIVATIEDCFMELMSIRDENNN